MENNFYKDDFEQFLRSNADDFRMVPSRKVWYSIYNNMHPDRKWPSLTVCLIILSAVLFIGISNNNSIGDAARKAGAENLRGIAKNYITSNTNDRPDFAAPLAAAAASGIQKQHSFSITAVADEVSANSENPNLILSESSGPENIFNNTTVVLNESGAVKEAGKLFKAADDFSNTAQYLTFLKQGSAENTGTAIVTESFKNSEKNNIVATNISENKITKAASAEQNKIAAHNSHRAWIEDYAFHNKPEMSRFKQHATLSYFVTPSVGYRILRKKTGYSPSTENLYGSLMNAPAPLLLNSAFDDAPSLNLEVGATVNYSVSENFRLKTGLQFNYTNYVTRGSELGHPAQTSVAVPGSAQQIIHSTDYSTGKEGNKTNLNHTSMQVSFPVGFDLALAGNDKIKWYVGGTIQPSYVLGGSALVLSSDEKNLISEKSLQRKLNINAGAETFISYKTGTGIVVNVGPQLRYQVLSTFKKPYAYKENLFSTGIRLGITRNF